MNAKMTHFAMLIPDWNSLDSVRRTHNDLEGAAIVFFALVVLFDLWAHFAKDTKRETGLERIALMFFAVAVLAELAAFPYGQRNDTLSEQIIGSLDTKARDAANNASLALSNSVDAEAKSNSALDKAGKARDDAGAAETKVVRLEATQQELAKSGAQLRTDINLDELRLVARQSGHTFWYHLFGSLRGQRPGSASIVCLSGTTLESRLFAEKLSVALRDVGWISTVAPKTWDEPRSPSGVTILNKWAEEEATGRIDPILGEPDPSWLARTLVLGKSKMNVPDAHRLAALTETLGATLGKAEGLDDDSFQIIIGDPTKNK
jgi:hypothetical protein